MSDLSGAKYVGKSPVEMLAINKAESRTRLANRVASIVENTVYVDKSFVGRIEPMLVRDTVVQHVGRGNTILHLAIKLDRIPAVGEIAEIKYDSNGRAKVTSHDREPKGIAD